MTGRIHIVKQFRGMLKGQLKYRKEGFLDEVDCFKIANDLLLSIDDTAIYEMVARDPALGIIDWEWLLDSNSHNDLLRASDIIRQNLLGYLLPKAYEIIKEFDWEEVKQEGESS